ncbi:glycosyltransferase family 2 protein [Paenibacillus sp. CAU 1782]
MRKTAAKASVVIPVYNAGRKLGRCVDSVLEQSCPDIEVILVNDGSTDGSGDLCRRYVEMDCRVLLLEQDKTGSIRARRRGVEAALAPYVVFADADDWMDAKLVESLLKVAETQEADIAVCNTYRVIDGLPLLRRRNRSRYFQSPRNYEGEQIRDELVAAYLHGHPFPATLHGKLYRRELLLGCGAFLEDIVFFGDDLFYNLEMLLNARRVAVLPECLYYYRSGGTTSRYMPHLFPDIVNGYRIQQEVADRCFGHPGGSGLAEHRRGISEMLLRTLLTCLVYLFYADMTTGERMRHIGEYCNHPAVRESLYNLSGKGSLPRNYMLALQNRDSAGLHALARRIYTGGVPKRAILKLLSFIPSPL